MCSIAIGTEPVRYSIGIEATSENNLNVMVCAESIEEMEHADRLETQLGLIEGMGLENYLQSQMKPV